MIRIGHGNGHNRHSLANFVRETQTDSFGCNESDRLLKAMRKIPGRRLIAPSGDGVRDPRAASSCISTSNARENLGSLVRKVSEPLPNFSRVAPTRTLVASFFAHPLATRMGFEGVAHFNLHPDAGPAALAGTDPAHPLVREYREALVSTAVWMKAARRDGLLLILTGDLQVRAVNDRPWSPRNLIADELDLAYWTTNIDWCIYDKRLKLVEPPRLRQLYDHTGFVVSLGRKGAE